MISRRLIILFGLPGAGKTYVGKVLRDEFGYFLYNADRNLPRVMRQTLYRRAPISNSMRDTFFANILKYVVSLTKNYTKVAVAQTFLKERYRKTLLKQFPYALFLLITADTPIRESRYQKRNYFNLGLAYLRSMSAGFEEPSIPHTTIVNNTQGKGKIREQLHNVLDDAPGNL